jgi:succinoglycan biosynthesis transport protein ExoP
VVAVRATDPNPMSAARLANSFAQQYIAIRRDADRSKIRQAQNLVQRRLARGLTGPSRGDLERRAEELAVLASLQTGKAELVQPAEVPTSPSSPRPVRNAILGSVLGLLLGGALALHVEQFDRRLKDPDEIGRIFERPILGAIPESRELAKPSRNFQVLSPHAAEAFLMLRANLRYFHVDRGSDRCW